MLQVLLALESENERTQLACELIKYGCQIQTTQTDSAAAEIIQKINPELIFFNCADAIGAVGLSQGIGRSQGLPQIVFISKGKTEEELVAEGAVFDGLLSLPFLPQDLRKLLVSIGVLKSAIAAKGGDPLSREKRYAAALGSLPESEIKSVDGAMVNRHVKLVNAAASSVNEQSDQDRRQCVEKLFAKKK